MALNDILTSMDGARDALVTAINAKGGSLADNATFYQCADAVGSLSGGISAEYYKCASVDTEANTWSGYKAVQQENGGYTFEETVTTGLTYTTITPVVDSIYSADCMILVGYMVPADTAVIPDSPLLLYMPLQTDVSATTGQNPNNINNVTFTTNQGIPCAYFDSSAYIDAGNGIPPTQNTAGNVSATFSFWAKLDSGYDGGYTFSNYNTIHFVLYADKLVFSRDGGFSIEVNVNATVWHNYTVLFEGSKCFIYIDGVKMAEADNTQTIINTYTFYISCFGNYMSSPRFKGHLTAFRYYDASLSEAEILALAKEFTPTT